MHDIKNLKWFCLFLFTLFVSVSKGNASDAKNSQKENIDRFIQHHLEDDYYFSLFKDEENNITYGFPLPVILIDEGINIFSSSRFIHTDGPVQIEDKFYRIDHNKIYRTDGNGDKLVEANKFVKPIDLSITKNVVGLILTAVLMFFMFIALAKSYRKNKLPQGFGRVLEPLIIYVRDEMAKPNIGSRYQEFLPYLLSVFFLIWILNLIGLTPLGFNVTGNITVTLCLALFTLIITNIKASRSYWKHIFWMPGVPIPFRIALMPIEVIGIFTKAFSLMIRLFANNVAGHTVIMGLIAIIYLLNNQLTLGGSIAVSLLLTSFLFIIKLLAAFLQAYIFTMLSSLFIGLAVQEDEHH